MKIGDKVRPVESFDFETYGGPVDIDDTGLVVDIDTEGDAIVEWIVSGETNTHIVNGSIYHQRDPEAFDLFGIIPA